MPYEVRRPSDRLGERPKLSRFGRTVFAVAAIVVLVVVGWAYAAVQASRAREELARDVVAAVERAKVVCNNAASAVGAGSTATDRIASFAREIDAKRSVEDKAVTAQEMINYTLGLVGTNQAQLDELHGATNRLLLALQQYRGAQ